MEILGINIGKMEYRQPLSGGVLEVEDHFNRILAGPLQSAACKWKVACNRKRV